MKNIAHFAITAAVLFAPVVALAEDGSLPPPPQPTIGSAIRQIASTTRNEIHTDMQQSRDAMHALASSTRAAILGDRQQGRQDIRAIILDRVAALKAMMGSSTPDERQQLRADSKAAVEEKRADIASSTAAAKLEAQAKFSQGVQISVGNIVDHLTKATTDLSSIADRIDLRITELQNQGNDMTNSAALLVSARADIATAQDKTTAVGTALTTALSSAKPKDQVPAIRAAVKAAEDALKTAKESLQKTLQSIRAEVGTSVNATTTTQI